MTDEQIPYHTHSNDGTPQLDPKICFQQGFAIFDHIPTLDEYTPVEGIPFIANNGSKYVLMALVAGSFVDLTGM